MIKEKSLIKSVCNGCAHYDVCGDSTRKEPCEGYKLKMNSENGDGYHKNSCREPFILEREDWSEEQFAVFLKLFNLPEGTVRIAFNCKDVAYFVDHTEMQEMHVF